MARGEVAPDDLLDAARACVAAADAPRFLKPLCTWLDRRGWKKLPPPKRERRAKGKAQRRRYGKPDFAAISAEMAAEAEAWEVAS